MHFNTFNSLLQFFNTRILVFLISLIPFFSIAQSKNKSLILQELTEDLLKGKISSIEFANDVIKLNSSLSQRNPEKSLLDSAQIWNFNRPSGSYVFESKYFYIYGIYEMPEVIEIYNSANNILGFSLSFRLEYLFNEDGHITEIITKRFDNTTSSLVNMTKFEFYYNQELLLSQDYFEWNIATQKWETSQKNEYKYENKKLTEEIFYYKNLPTDTNWIINFRRAHILNQIGLDSIVSGDSWNKSTQDWHSYELINRSFNDKMKIESDSQYILSRGNWVLNNCEKYEYDLRGNETNKVYYRLNSQISELDTFSIEYSEYDDINNKLKYYFYFWNINLSEVNAVNKSHYKYEYNSENQITIRETFRPAEDVMVDVPERRENYFYSLHNVSSGINNTNEDDLKVYPIPFDEYLLIEGIPMNSHISIVSLDGKFIFRNLNLKNSNSLDLSELNSGMYVLQIISKGNIISKRINKS